MGGVRGGASVSVVEAMGVPSQDSTVEVLKGREEAEAKVCGLAIAWCLDVSEKWDVETPTAHITGLPLMYCSSSV